VPSDTGIRIPLHREEATVQKRPVIREEIVIRRRMVADTRPVETDLRRERIDIEGAVDPTRPARSNPNFTDTGDSR
jgi:uncharacterized protein (TIGR02271 family)